MKQLESVTMRLENTAVNLDALTITYYYSILSNKTSGLLGSTRGVWALELYMLEKYFPRRSLM